MIKDSIRGEERVEGKIEHSLNLSSGITPNLIVDKIYHPPLLGKKGLEIVQKPDSRGVDRIEVKKNILRERKGGEGILYLFKKIDQQVLDLWFLFHQSGRYQLLDMTAPQREP